MRLHDPEFRRLSLPIAAMLTVAVCSGLVADDRAANDRFSTGPAAVLLTRCVECHSGQQPAGGLNLTTYDGVIKGGDTGPAITAGQPESSSLIERVEAGEMPPAKQGKSQRLSDVETAALRDWIRDGATWPTGRVLDPFEKSTAARAGRDWWSLQPIRSPAAPTNSSTNSIGAANPIDAFVESKLASRGWTLAPEADRRTLIRRLYYDLWGLPAAADEVDAFIADTLPDAWDRLVDRLLSSPHFGERFGRRWLDVVRYAETCGYERDQVKPHAWKYRDWVVAAFSNDKPWPDFVREQLAGDELPNRSEETVIATGMLCLGTWNDEPNDPAEYQFERMEDMVHVTSTAFLGLTVKCARCHDHKFDPIRQSDYYRVAGAFWAGFIEPGSGKQLGGPDAEQLGFDLLGWTDRSASPPPLPLLIKGDHNRPGPPVEPGHLSAIPVLDRPLAPAEAGSKTTGRRRQLAEWIVDPQNPLARRVWVNRLWQWVFARGIVRNPDNFGFSSEQPLHADLLDWLASESLHSGDRPKHLIRLMATSRVYRQDSIAPNASEYEKTDAGNLWLWRAERKRLDAESLRDALLAASGRLQLDRIGGPSIIPVVSAEALEGLSMRGADWKPSPESEQGRRSIYLFTRRHLLPPILTVFDFPDTTLPCGQRDVTIVAPQALALLNNEFVHNQSRSLAEQAMTTASDPNGQIIMAWRCALGRNPTEAERHAARQLLDAQKNRRTAAGDASASTAAFADLCHALLNCNEFLYID